MKRPNHQDQGSALPPDPAKRVSKPLEDVGDQPAICGSGLTRRDFAKLVFSGTTLFFVDCGTPTASNKTVGYDWKKYRWGYAIDIAKCIGCCACMRACRAENDVPEGYHRTWVERYRIDSKGRVRVDVAAKGDHVFEDDGAKDIDRAFFVPKLCNHCSGSVCTQVCPVGASYHTPDGVVLVDDRHCVGCGYCVQACPYSCRFINPKTHIADKCTWCYHRLPDKGPVCAMVCPTGARVFGNLKDPKSKISRMLKRQKYRVLRPEMGTDPNCYYHDLDREVL